MPELPEVETIRRQLEKEIAGKRISQVEVRFAKRLNVGTAEFKRVITGARVVSVGRRAKLLLLGLANGWTLAVHLKMTGRLLLVPAGSVPGKHVHVVFRLSGRRSLFFEDVRKFGYLRLVRTADLEKTILAEGIYGPEPLTGDFTLARFAGCLRRFGRQKIKPSLMDQTCIAGVGNIYADESLWRSKLRPDRRVASLEPEELRALHRGILVSLKSAVKNRGTSADDYLDLYGRAGENEARLKAYGRGGRRCSRCGGTIVKVRLAGRGTHYCPRCQK